MTKEIKTNTSTDVANPFGNLTTIFDQFTVPQIDMPSFVDARRKDFAVLVEVNKIGFEAMQELVHTQADMFTQAMQGIENYAKESSNGKVGVPDVAKRTEAAGDAWQKVLANMKRLTDITQKSQAAAFAGLTKRAGENIAEAKRIMFKP